MYSSFESALNNPDGVDQQVITDLATGTDYYSIPNATKCIDNNINKIMKKLGLSENG